MNLISVGETELSFQPSLCQSSDGYYLGGIVYVIFLVALLLIFRSRLHSAKMKLELEKAEAGSQAKSDFISDEP